MERGGGVKLIFFKIKFFEVNYIMTHDIFNQLSQLLPVANHLDTGHLNARLFLVKPYVRLIKEDQSNYGLFMSITLIFF